MIIGLDFDNTIVCYDQAISILAEQMFDLPAHVSRTKIGLRDYLRTNQREPEWTAFQGELYGPGMKHALPFEGAIAAINKLKDTGHTLKIISHRSRYPYAGTKHDLHDAAYAWIERNLEIDERRLFDRADVHFLQSKEEKISKIKELQCAIFMDDLPEILSDANFPPSIRKFLFDPQETIADQYEKLEPINHWSTFSELIG